MGKKVPIGGVPVEFPFQPYPAQIQMMAKMVQALKQCENALLESPTGSGKSLAILCGALAWRQHHAQQESERYTREVAEAKSRRDERALQKEAEEFEQDQQQLEIGTSQASASVALDEDGNEIVLLDSPEQAKLGKSAIKRAHDSQPEPSLISISSNDDDAVQTEAKKYLKSVLKHLPIVLDDDDDFKPPIVAKRRKFNPSSTSTDPDDVDCKAPLHTRLETDTDATEFWGYDSDMVADPAAMAMAILPPRDSQYDADMANIRSPDVPRIYVCSRTHKQLEQLVREMKNYTPYRPRMTILGSREQLCIHKKVSRSSNKADDCMKLVDEKKCPLYFKTKRINAHESIRHDKANVWDIEDIVRVGKMVQGCPYYATRSEFEHAELIFCPYNYILDPTIREIMGINVTGAVVILDEAHNVEDVARESGSFEVTDVELKRIAFHLAELIKYKVLPEKHAHLRHVVTSIEDWMIQEEDTAFHIQEFERRVKVWSGPQIVENMDNLQISKQNLADILLPAFDEALELRQAADEEDELLEEEAQEAGQRKIMKGLPMSDLRVLQGLFMVLKYLFQEDQDHQDDYSMVLIKQIAPQSTLGNWKLKLGFWCHNPGIVFRELSALTRSVVLTSGTLSPLDTFATELDTKFAMTIETNHVIDKSQVWINTLPIGPSGAIMKGVYTTMETFQYQDDVGETLLQISSIVPYGVLCFMPSYSAMDKLLNRWKTTGIYESLEQKKQIFIEPRGDNKHQFRKLITSYYKCISDLEAGISTSNGGINGSLFFAVYRGKVSEGIDFKDNQCRAVVSIGVPYPSFKETKVSLKREYNDQKKRKYGSTRRAISGNEWYDSQAFRAINQALGRCIRHRKDWGAIILLEERFAHERHINGLSKWIRRLRDSNNLPFHAKMEDLQEFVHRQSPADKEIQNRA